MKSLAISVAIALCFGLSACAGGMGQNGISRSEPAGHEVDMGKVAAVNQWAQTKGATVIWLNYPLRASRGRTAGG